jgi:aryl-alcohol dehydrogenase-like predicted oxidoreductase
MKYMAQKGKSMTRKDFIRKSSIGIIGTGMMAGSPIRLLDSKSRLRITTLGSTGIETTGLGIGATRTQEPNIIKAAMDGGIRFLDTGRTYANGRNEEMIGSVIRDFRKEITIQSKVRIGEEFLAGKTRNESKEQVVENFLNNAIDESLAALQTDYIDIYLVHDVTDTTVPYDEAVLKAFENAKKSGKIRASGFSTHSNMAALVAHNNANPHYDVIMVAFNHRGGYVHSQNGRKYDWDQASLVEELKVAVAGGTGIVAMKTCSGGVKSLDPGREASLSQAVKWVLMQDYVHTAVPAMASFSQVESHIQENKA